MKLVLSEPGSVGALEVWHGADRIVSSELLYPEARSALGRVARAGRIPPNDVLGARARVERLWRDIDRVEVTTELVSHAGDLTESQALRAYDAVHLASALSVGDDAVLVAADGDLLAAAHALELATAGLG